MKKDTYVVQPIIKDANKNNPCILRFVMSEKSTRIDFGYAAPWIYKKGGWIRIAPYSYLKIKDSTKKYLLLRTHNIPISPDRHDFETIEDWKVFSLYFEPLPLKDCIVDLIEEENPTKNDFNYYGILLEGVQNIVLAE
jgi:hypothetical protein